MFGNRGVIYFSVVLKTFFTVVDFPPAAGLSELGGGLSSTHTQTQLRLLLKQLMIQVKTGFTGERICSFLLWKNQQGSFMLFSNFISAGSVFFSVVTAEIRQDSESILLYSKQIFSRSVCLRPGGALTEQQLIQTLKS